LTIDDIELDLDSAPIRVKVLHDSPELHLGGKSLLKENNEIEVPRWMARELSRVKMVSILERDALDMTALAKIHWRESIPGSREIPQMEYDFFHRLRCLLGDLSEASERDPTKRIELEKAQSQFKDILNCRVRKILNAAAASPLTDSTLQKMTAEEQVLFSQLSTIIKDWKQKVVFPEDEK
jgi:hypothetical protein